MSRVILLTPLEVASRLGLNRPDRIYAMIGSGELKASNIGSGMRPRWRVRESELNSFLERRENGTVKRQKRANANINAEVPRYV